MYGSIPGNGDLMVHPPQSLAAPSSRSHCTPFAAPGHGNFLFAPAGLLVTIPPPREWISQRAFGVGMSSRRNDVIEAEIEPSYATTLGQCFEGDALDVLRKLADNSVALVL